MSVLSEVSIKKPVFAWMLMFGLMIFGAISYKRMGVSQLPDVDFPFVTVSLSLNGAAPEVMEADVVDPVEQALTSVQGITGMTSSARSGSASVNVEFELNKDIDVAVQEIQTAVSRAQRALPKDMDPPVVQKFNPDSQPIVWLGVTAEKMSHPELMTYVRDRIKDRFAILDGVGEVFLGGYIEPNLRVWLSPKKLNSLALAPGDVVSSIQAEHVELPSGRIESPEREFNIRTLGEAESVEAFSNLMISRRGGQPNYVPLRIRDVAKVEDGLADVRRVSRSNGKFAIGLGIRKQAGANSVEVAKRVKAEMERLKTELPEGVQLGVRFDSTIFIEESTRELTFTLFLSAVLTAIVCWLFLGSWSATFNIIMAIPTSVLGTFIVLNALGFTLNTFTLLGLSLAIGIVVDDAIMVLENIVRHFEMGKDKVKASLDGSREITFAALAATAAIVAIFLPVAFMAGIIGKFFYQFGVTLSAAVLISLLEALTLAPMRTSQFMNKVERRSRIGQGMDRLMAWLGNTYRAWLPTFLNHPWKTVAAGTVFFLATMFLVVPLKKEFTPAQDTGSLMIRMQTDIGSSLEFTDQKFKEVEALLIKKPELASYFGSVGGFGGGDVNSVMVFVRLRDDIKRPTTQQMIEKLREELKTVKGAKITIQDPSLSSFSGRRGFPIEASLRGGDFKVLGEAATNLMKAMESSGKMIDVDSDYREGMPEIQIHPDRLKSQARGVSVSDVAQTVNIMMGGVVAGKFMKNGHRQDIRVSVDKAERGEWKDLKKLWVRNNRGELIPLESVVEIKEGTGLQTINRDNRERAISLYANMSKGVSQDDAMKTLVALAKDKLPKGVTLVQSGSAKTFREASASLMMALWMGILISYMVLASQFNSFIHPVTVLIALPFSVSGAFVSLLLTGQSLNMYSFIGILLLMGIVKKNSILLVEFTNQLREEGKGVREALLEACPVRLRPILMTSFTTIAAAIPPALKLGPGAETNVPMSIAVIGGVTVSTFLTLIVVPAVYVLFSKIQRTKAHAVRTASGASAQDVLPKGSQALQEAHC